MLLLGSTFTPEEAKTAGLVGSVVVDALDTAIAFARKIMSRPLAQSGHLKRLVRSACDMPIDEGRKLERLLSADIATSEEGLAVLARFNRRNGDIRNNHCE